LPKKEKGKTNGTKKGIKAGNVLIKEIEGFFFHFFPVSSIIPPKDQTITEISDE